MKVHELYENVTRNIINEIEAGNLPPWLLPFKRSRRTGILPMNAATNRPYNGINIFVLWGGKLKATSKHLGSPLSKRCDVQVA